MTAKAATGGTKVKAKAGTTKSHYTRAQNTYGRKLTRIRKRNKSKRVASRGAAGPAVEQGYWLAGDNDTMPSCVAVGIANAVLAQTGRRCTPEELEALSVALSAKDGVFIPDALHALTKKESE